MNIERAFGDVPRFDNEEYKRLMESTIRHNRLPTLMQEVKEVFDLKAKKDISDAEKRAKGCGCRNCHMDAQNTKEWYGA